MPASASSASTAGADPRSKPHDPVNVSGHRARAVSCSPGASLQPRASSSCLGCRLGSPATQCRNGGAWRAIVPSWCASRLALFCAIPSGHCQDTLSGQLPGPAGTDQDQDRPGPAASAWRMPAWRGAPLLPCLGVVPRGRLVSTFSTSSRARGARRARLAAAPGQAPREDDADPDAAQLPPVTRRAFQGTLRAGRRLPHLGPPGHGGVGARAVPAARHTGSAPQRSAPGARTARAGHPPGAPV